MLEPLFHKVADLRTCNFIKRRLLNRYFSVSIAKILRTTILKNICQRLLFTLVILILMQHVFYHLAKSRKHILKAMKEISRKSCIRFVEHTDEKNWVKFVDEGMYVFGVIFTEAATIGVLSK